MVRRIVRAVAAFLIAGMATAAMGREQSDAPEVEMIGFSPDGRYFAYEQYAWDPVSDAVFSAVFVLDRDTNALVPDFPIGLVPEERDGEFPARVGGFDPDPALIDTGDGTPDLLGLRKAVRAEAEVRLAALEIGLGGRRIAGVPITQRAPTDGRDHPLTFVLAPTIASAIPDQQYSFTMTGRAPIDPDDCGSNPPAAWAATIGFDVVTTVAWPEMKEIGRLTTPYVLPVAADRCITRLWLSDVIAPPADGASGPAVVVMFLTSYWAPGADDADWHALYVRLPEGKPE